MRGCTVLDTPIYWQNSDWKPRYCFNVDAYPPSNITFLMCARAILEHFLYGLVSQKGYTLAFTASG